MSKCASLVRFGSSPSAQTPTSVLVIKCTILLTCIENSCYFLHTHYAAEVFVLLTACNEILGHSLRSCAKASRLYKKYTINN
jgi:hypothetical protein